MRTEAAPGPWLRLTAVAAAAGTLLAVISGAAGLDTAHRLVAAVTVPPLVALVVAGWVAHRRLLTPSVVALALFGGAALLVGRDVHVALAALAFAGTLYVAVEAHRGERVSSGPWRDYLTLTKPRIMSLLRLTGFCGMVVGAQGW